MTTNRRRELPIVPLSAGCLFLAVCVWSIGHSLFFSDAPETRCSGCGRLMQQVSEFENLNGRLARFQCACGRSGQLATPVDGASVWSESGPEDKARPE
ncbi:MAG: hypothetical protein IPM64_17940 [Phycisphaerales bacterium]|nr:hypothetical protein [Phycisphaerales bacterium]